MTEIQTVTVETTMAPEVIEVYSGPRGEQGPIWHTGAFPPEEGVGRTNDLYLVSEGATNEGNVYKKSSDGTWVPSGNIRGATGGIQSINGKTGNSVIISAEDITTGVIGMSQMPTGTTAGTVALGNHNHDSVYEGIIPAGTTSQYLRGDKTWQSLSAAAVGLGNVNNTSDLSKPISTATQTALDLKQDKIATAHNYMRFHDVLKYTDLSSVAKPHLIITTNIPLTGAVMLKINIKAYSYQRGAVDGWLTAYMYNNSGGTIHLPKWVNSGDYSPEVTVHKNADNNLVIALTGQWQYSRISVPEVEFASSNTPTFRAYAANWMATVADDLTGLTQTPIYTSNHNNLLEEIGKKQDSIPLGTTSQFYRGDKTWQPITKSVVGLGNVDNTSDLAKPISTATATALAGKVSTSGNEAIGGTKTFSSAPIVPDNSFAISKVNGLQTALSAKAPTANPTFTGTVNGITKEMVGLGNVDNTSDAEKPVPPSVQNSLNSKATKTELSAVMDAVEKMTEDPTVKLAPLFAALARRSYVPAKIVFLGSSTTFGAASGADKFRYVDRFLHSMQAAYPSPIPGHFPRPQTLGEAIASPDPLPGVQGINAGFGGTTTRNYFGQTHVNYFSGMDIDCYIHMIGSNDSLAEPTGVPIAEYETNINNALNSLDAINTSGTPCCHVLVHTFRRIGVTESHWNQYRDVLRKISEERNNVYFIDINDVYKNALMPGTDPYGLLSSDDVHQTDFGYELMADLMLRKLGIEYKGHPDTAMMVAYDTFTAKNGPYTQLEYPANKLWIPSAGSTWEVQNRKMTVAPGGTLLMDSGLTDVDISVGIRTSSNTSTAGIAWRALNDADRYGTFLNTITGRLQIYRTTAGAGTIVAEANYSFQGNKDYWLRTIVRGDRVSNFVNGKITLEYTIPAGDSFNNYTHVGLRAAAGTGLGFYGFAVRRV